MKNSLNINITRPSQVLFIMRGVPGSGKSFKANSLKENGVIHSTDDLIESQGDYMSFFQEMFRTKNFANLNRMHSKNLANAKKSMEEGITPVIIDNTNIKANESKAYVKHALDLGFSDENIRIVDIGTGGLTVEQLAARNTHGVPADAIAKMVESYKSVGPLSVKKIMGSSDMYKANDILYSAIVLDEISHEKLLKVFGFRIPVGWKTYAHHMTITMGKSAAKEDLGSIVELVVKYIGWTTMAIAVGVEGYTSQNASPHITLAVNPDGGKPAMSNQITNWTKVENIKVKGTVTNIKS